MPSKLKLDLEHLAVESFDTSRPQAKRGTVFGEQCTCYTNCTCPGCPTCDTCAATCAYTCDDYTCANSCNGTCAGATCDNTCAASCYATDCGCNPGTCYDTACGNYMCCA